MGNCNGGSVDPQLKNDYIKLKEKQQKLQLNRPKDYKDMID